MRRRRLLRLDFGMRDTSSASRPDSWTVHHDSKELQSKRVQVSVSSRKITEKDQSHGGGFESSERGVDDQAERDRAQRGVGKDEHVHGLRSHIERKIRCSSKNSETRLGFENAESYEAT